MILALHALSGAAIAQLVPSAGMVLPLAFASHFVFDRMPHTDYRVGAILGTKRMPGLFYDFAKSFVDFFLGLAAVAILTEGNMLALAAAFCAMLPDGLWVFNALFPRLPFLGRFRALHQRIHYQGERKVVRTLPFDIAATAILLAVLVSA